jgi:hypothetical protein
MESDNQNTQEQIEANQSISKDFEAGFAIPQNIEANIPPETPKGTAKLTKYETAALALKRLHPEMTPHAIGQALLKSRLSRNFNTIYQRFKLSDYFKTEFVALEKYHREQLVREDLPLARKVVRKHLKNKDKSTPAAVQIQAAKLVYDKALADRQDKMTDSPVNIENIERLQVVIGGALD